MSKINAPFRAWPYALLFALLTGIEGIIAFGGGLIWNLSCGWFTYYHPLGLMPWWWGWQINQYCFQPLGFRWRMGVENPNALDDNRLKIVLFKHPPTLMTWTVAYLPGLFISQRMAFVLKGSHMFNPMGWGLWGLGLAIFSTRFHEWSFLRYWPWLQGQLTLLSRWWFSFQVRRMVKRAKRTPGGIAIVILPDPRFTEERLAAMLANPKIIAEIPDLAKWDHQLPPRPNGTLELFRATAGINVPVYWVSCTLRIAAAEGWLNFGPYVHGEAQVTVRDVTAQLKAIAPVDEISRIGRSNLVAWFNELYRAQNVADSRYRES